MNKGYRAWLEAEKYEPGTVSAQLHRAGRVESEYGDLDALYEADGLEGVLATLEYSTSDARRNKPNPSKIRIDGDLRSNLASYKDAVRRYIKFKLSVPAASLDQELRPAVFDEQSADEVREKIGLERDLQASLRRAIGQLEPGLTIIDDGAERSVSSGFIDITARDSTGALVVIELKAGTARRDAIGQILSYMGDLQEEHPTKLVRGILVAAGFDAKSQAAARMVTNLQLRIYSVRFSFTEPI